MAAKVYLGPLARTSTQSPQKLKKAEALAASLTLPAGVEFARFDFQGRTCAISARVTVEVELLASRAPDVVVRGGAGINSPRAAARPPAGRPRRAG